MLRVPGPEEELAVHLDGVGGLGGLAAASLGERRDEVLAEHVTDHVHPMNLYLAERVARVMGLDVAGIDLIAPSHGPVHGDPASTLAATMAAFSATATGSVNTLALSRWTR